MVTADVSFWRKADIPVRSADVRFWGQSRHHADEVDVLRDGGDLLCRDMISADHVTPKLDLALEQGIGSLGRLLIVWVKIHAAVVKCLS